MVKTTYGSFPLKTIGIETIYADHLCQLKDEEELKALLNEILGQLQGALKEKYASLFKTAVLGSKIKIEDWEVADLLRGAVHARAAEQQARPVPGGSTANAIVTMRGIMGRRLEKAYLVGVIEGKHKQVLGDALGINDISLISPRFPEGSTPESGESFIFYVKGKDRTAFPYPGNALGFMTKENFGFPEGELEFDALKNDNGKGWLLEAFLDSNFFFLQGSLWVKMEREMIDQLLKLRWQMKMPLMLCFPTGTCIPEEIRERARYAFPSANLTCVNTGEAMQLYGEHSKDEALQNMWRAYIEAPHQPWYGEHREFYENYPRIALITDGPDDAYLFMPGMEGPVIVPALQVDNHKIVCTLGAGDATTGAFQAFIDLGVDPLRAAKASMYFGAQAIQQLETQLDDQGIKCAYASMKECDADLFDAIYHKIHLLVSPDRKTLLDEVKNSPHRPPGSGGFAASVHKPGAKGAPAAYLSSSR